MIRQGLRVGLTGFFLLGWAAPALAAPLRSEVEGLVIAPLDHVPVAPVAAAAREGCEHLLVAPRGAAGRAVAAAGWAVTAEGRLGAYDAVSFVGGFDAGTSGTCALADGNVALFDGERIFAVVYVPHGAGISIGRVRPREPDALRLWDGDFLSTPIADLAIDPDGAVTVTPLAAEETVCGGRGVVPNIYGLAINLARGRLSAAGWQPVPGEMVPGVSTRERGLQAAGVIEVDACAGTGLAFCAFRYRLDDMVLNVYTAGEEAMPSVVDYGAECPKP